MIGQRRDGDVAVIEIERHERRNALDAAHCDGLGAAVREQAAGGARALVITGAGSSFCSGADLGGRLRRSRFPPRAWASRWTRGPFAGWPRWPEAAAPRPS
jgi:enoyl-CoA hydratase